MRFAFVAIVIFAAEIEFELCALPRLKAGVMAKKRFLRDFFKACALYSRTGIRKKFIYKFGLEADSFE